MRKFFIYFLIIFFAIVLQTSSIPLLFNSVWIPDLMLMLILAWALIDGFEKFLPWAIFAGFLYDLASFSAVGTNIIVFVLASYGVGFFSKRFSTEMKGVGILLAIFFVFSATFGSRLIYSSDWIESVFRVGGFEHFIFMGKSFFMAFFWNLAIFFLCFFAINRMEEVFYFKRKNNIIV